MAIKKIDKHCVSESKFIHFLRNKKYVKLQSLKSNKIQFKHHENWFKKFILNKNNTIYLIILKKKKAGYIRIEKKTGKYLTSWALLKKFHGKGIMTRNLRKTTNNKKFRYAAIIKKANVASIRVASKSGFKISKFSKSSIYFTK